MYYRRVVAVLAGVVALGLFLAGSFALDKSNFHALYYGGGFLAFLIVAVAIFPRRPFFTHRRSRRRSMRRSQPHSYGQLHDHRQQPGMLMTLNIHLGRLMRSRSRNRRRSRRPRY